LRLCRGHYELDLAVITFVNDALCKHLGYTKEELIGTKSNHYQDDANGKKTYQAFNEIYRTGEPVKALGSEYIRKDGTKGTYEMSASLIRDAQGKPIGFRGVTRDITERKRAEEALRQSEEKYRTIIENIQDGYFENDLAGNFTFTNDVICRHLDIPREIDRMNYRQDTDENGRRLFQTIADSTEQGNRLSHSKQDMSEKMGANWLPRFRYLL
jgi:PAS domain S-box-containing protein